MTPAGKRSWAPAAMHKLIQNRVYLGELHHGAMSNGSLAPAADRSGHLGCGPAPEDRRSRRVPSLADGAGRHAAAGCRMVMRSQMITRNGQRKRVYFCGGAFTAGECPSPAWITGAVAEPYVDAVFFALAARRRPVRKRSARLRRLVEAYERAKTGSDRLSRQCEHPL